MKRRSYGEGVAKPLIVLAVDLFLLRQLVGHKVRWLRKSLVDIVTC